MATVLAPRFGGEDAPRLSLVAKAAVPASQDIDSTLHENRVFAPPTAFSAQAHISSMEEYQALYQQSIADPEAFWADAAENLHWFKRWDKVLEWDLPWAKWFVGGKLNLSYNCVDRHALGGLGNKTAIIWEGEPGEQRRMSYAELRGCRLFKRGNRLAKDKLLRLQYIPHCIQQLLMQWTILTHQVQHGHRLCDL